MNVSTQGAYWERWSRIFACSFLLAWLVGGNIEAHARAEGPEHPLLTREVFETAFPEKLEFYEYEALLQALATFPSIFSVGSEDTRRLEVAAFLAQISHETGGLQYIREHDKSKWESYCDPSYMPCINGQLYYGRGPIQLSWNYNYALAGVALGHDLLSTPSLVERDATLAFQTAIWFWTTQTGAGTLTAHHAMTEGIGFAETTRSINGSLECNQLSNSVGYNQMINRTRLFLHFSEMINVPITGAIFC